VIDRIGTAVSRELQRFGTPAGLAPIVEAWPRAVGPEIARNAWPARIGRDGTLHVHVSASAWAFELTHLEARIRDALGQEQPRRIRFTVGPLPEPVLDEPESSRRHVPEPTAADVKRAAEIAAPIADENLRKIVAKTAQLSLAKANSDRMFW
jgi:hypothetical protein